MGTTTAIKWTDHTFNPWQGCVKVSPACDHCYAESLSKRVGHPERWGADGDRTVTGDGYWRNPLKWDAAATSDGLPHRVFCGSMCDVFEDRPDLAPVRERLFDLIEETPHLTWQLLTKRPENVQRMVPGRWLPGTEEGCTDLGCGEFPLDHAWPSNVWAGTTVEDQERADERLPHLLAIPAPVRFLSCEPLLGPVALRPEWIELELQAFGPGGAVVFPRVNWLICGGESGPGHRPLDLDHARSLRDQCAEHSVPFFFKQVGGATPTAGGDELDGRTHHEFPEVLR